MTINYVAGEGNNHFNWVSFYLSFEKDVITGKIYNSLFTKGGSYKVT